MADGKGGLIVSILIQKSWPVRKPMFNPEPFWQILRMRVQLDIVARPIQPTHNLSHFIELGIGPTSIHKKSQFGFNFIRYRTHLANTRSTIAMPPPN